MNRDEKVRRKEIDSHLQAGKSACLFARACVREYTTSTVPPWRNRGTMLKAAQRFVLSRGSATSHALIVVGAPVEAVGTGLNRNIEFQFTQAWARSVFLQLYVALLVTQGDSSATAELHVNHYIAPHLYDDAAPTRPMLSYDGEPLFAICMAPVYPEDHTRYAPYPCVVVTWVADVTRAAHEHPKSVECIRARMLKEHGSVYDAEELMLPLPPAVAHTSLLK